MQKKKQSDRVVDKNVNSNSTMKAKDFKVPNKGISGIDSMLPQLYEPPNMFNVLAAYVIVGGKDRGIKERTTNMQEGVTGGDVPLVDHRKDSRASATTLQATTNSNMQEQSSESQVGVNATGKKTEHMIQINDIGGFPIKDPNFCQKDQNVSPQALNNKSTLSLSEKKRDGIKKKQAMEQKRKMRLFTKK